jgi:hypothetical protein
MRLRLFERLGRLVGWRFGSQGETSGRPRDARAVVTDGGGRHRRNPGGGQPRGRPVAEPLAQPSGGGPSGRVPSARPPFLPPEGLPRSPQQPLSSGPGVVTPGGPALPPTPRNYAPTAGRGSAGGAVGQARIREAPFGAAPMETAAPQAQARPGVAAPRQPWYQVVGEAPAARRGAVQPGLGATHNGAAAAAGMPLKMTQRPVAHASAAQSAASGSAAALPFTEPHPRGYQMTADGRRNCGPLEAILWRQWDASAGVPPPQVIAAIDRLAEFPRQLQEKLVAGLDGIYIGVGGVPDLDDMAVLHGVPLPSGKATWDACAGAYGDRKIVVGTRPSPTPDVMCHEVGHALDDLDSPPGKWQSDSAEFRQIYDQCQPYIASDFHRQRGGLGRKEFFADAFAAIASAQRPALVDMLSGHTPVALRVMLYFNRRYGI